VVEAQKEMAAKLAIRPGSEEGDDLLDIGALRGGFGQ
jgi:hypothetical protein